jgi:hypothetical protein
MAIKNFYTGVYVGDNLGIGIDAPASKLHVNGNVLLSNNNELRWLSSTGAQEPILELNASDLLSLTGPGRIRIVPDGNAAIDLFSGHNTKYIMSSVHSWEDNNSNVALRITAGGNVGITDTSPNRQLTLGTAAPVLSLHSTSTTGESSIFFGDPDDDNEGRIVYSNSQDAMQIFTAAAERIRVTNAGDTGIGVTTPRAKLDVNGGIKVGNDLSGAGSNKVGTLRYRYVPGSPKNFSYVDMCMQTGTNSYAWVNIVQNVWN